MLMNIREKSVVTTAKLMTFWEVKSVTTPKETQDCFIIRQTFTIPHLGFYCFIGQTFTIPHLCFYC